MFIHLILLVFASKPIYCSMPLTELIFDLTDEHLLYMHVASIAEFEKYSFLDCVRCWNACR
jgi:hypothetical protein